MWVVWVRVVWVRVNECGCGSVSADSVGMGRRG